MSLRHGQIAGMIGTAPLQRAVHEDESHASPRELGHVTLRAATSAALSGSTVKNAAIPERLPIAASCLPANGFVSIHYLTSPRSALRSSRTVQPVGSESLAVTSAKAVTGICAQPVVWWSLYSLRTTGCGLSAGEMIQTAEGLSYTVVAGFALASVVTRVTTGSGLREAEQTQPRRTLRP